MNYLTATITMRRITLIITLLFSFIATAQDYPGTRPELLLNKQVKIIPPTENLKDGYKGFYSKEILSPLDMYAENASFRTKIEALQGRTFKVVAVTPFEESGSKKYKIKLEDTANSEIVYYQYDTYAEEMQTYVFEVEGGIDFPADYYKDYITTTKDKFTKEQTMVFEVNYLYKITKIKKGATAKYILQAEAAPRDNNVGKGKGAALLLANGKQIEKPQQVVTLLGNHYGVKIELTPADLALVKASRITDFRINKYNEELTPLQAQRLQGVLMYMLKN
jgi:hypothetical protein